MKNKNYAALAACVLMTFSAAPALSAAPKPVELSTAQLSVHQNKTYPAPARTAFSATIAALQSMGYTDIQSNRDSGTVTAVTEAKAKTFYNIFWGFGKKKLTQKASLFIEENGTAASTIRLNLHVNETKARGIFGTSFSDGKLVRVAEPYSEFWTVVDAEVARRAPGDTAHNTLVASPTIVVPVAAPAR